MGMSSDVELKVRAFKDGAKKRVQAIDLSEYNLVNWNDNGTLLICKDSDMAAGRNDYLISPDRMSHDGKLIAHGAAGDE